MRIEGLVVLSSILQSVLNFRTGCDGNEDHEEGALRIAISNCG
jgi:hypothetical protein